METCPNATRAFNQLGEIVYLACGSWSCPRCALVNSLHWAERVRYGVALWRPRPAYFWTLTLPGWVETAWLGYQLLPGAWNRLQNRIRRRCPDWHYAAFTEGHPHRDFIPHFHIISLARPAGRLKDWAVLSGFGHQAKEVTLTSGMAANYVSKYASKQGKEMPKNFRRVRISQDWPRLPEPAYEDTIFAPKKGETLSAYVYRVSGLVGVDVHTLLARYTAAKLALQSTPANQPAQEAGY